MLEQPIPQTEEPAQTQPAKTLTIRLPKFDVQTVVLALIAAVTVLQTVQLYSLKAATKGATVKSATAPAAAQTTGASGSSNSALPQMVGGC